MGPERQGILHQYIEINKNKNMKKLKIQTSKLALGNSCRFFASTYLGLTLLTKYSERYFSTSTVPVLDPFYITGLVDGEGS